MAGIHIRVHIYENSPIGVALYKARQFNFFYYNQIKCSLKVYELHFDVIFIHFFHYRLLICHLRNCAGTDNYVFCVIV